jgi:predicted ribosomally synthesized peptide with nif11-like leader
MSIEAVNQFLQKVTEDEKLQEELAQVLELEDNDRAAAVELGAKYGYEFTTDEIGQEIQNRQSEFQIRQEAGELNDEELEAVAGGEAVIATAAIAAGGLVTVEMTKKIKW